MVMKRIPKNGWMIRTRDSDNVILTLIVKEVDSRKEAVATAVNRHRKIARSRTLNGMNANVYLLGAEFIDALPNWGTHQIDYTMIKRPERIVSEPTPIRQPKPTVTKADIAEAVKDCTMKVFGTCYDSECTTRPCVEGMPDPKYQCPWYDLRGETNG